MPVNADPGPGANSGARLYLIRHGETGWNIEGRYQGQCDPPLNDAGHAQAQDLARRLRRARLDLVVSSPLRRALDTAEAIAARLNIPVVVDARLMEIHLGEWQGRLAQDIAAAWPVEFQRWLSAPWSMTPPGGESLQQVQQRVTFALAAIGAGNSHRRLGVVTHRVPIVLAAMRYLHVPPDRVHTAVVPNGAWLSFVLDGEAVRRPRGKLAILPDGRADSF
jgi:broad specificity phosphatase PhoE